jgi:hypothetical protein
MMKRMMQAGLLVAGMALTVQAQITAAGSNFTGPGGGGSGVSSTIGGYVPGLSSTYFGVGGNPGGATIAGYSGATSPTTVTLGSGTNSLQVTISASDQNAAGATLSGNPSSTAFLQSLGAFGSTPAAQSLANALTQLGAARNAYVSGGGYGQATSALQNAINAFNAAVQALPTGSAVPGSLIAARALIAGLYT